MSSSDELHYGEFLEEKQGHSTYNVPLFSLYSISLPLWWFILPGQTVTTVLNIQHIAILGFNINGNIQYEVFCV